MKVVVCDHSEILSKCHKCEACSRPVPVSVILFCAACSEHSQFCEACSEHVSVGSEVHVFVRSWLEVPVELKSVSNGTAISKWTRRLQDVIAEILDVGQGQGKRSFLSESQKMTGRYGYEIF